MPGKAKRRRLAEMPDFMSLRDVAGVLGVSEDTFEEGELARLGIPHVILRRQRDRVRVSKAAFKAWERGL